MGLTTEHLPSQGLLGHLSVGWGNCGVILQRFLSEDVALELMPIPEQEGVCEALGERLVAAQVSL